MLLPPKGYLQRLREICDKHGILLIFDEVITGFGRVGAPFAATHFGVTPDMMTVAKGLTNGTVPMGAVFAKQYIHDAFMHGPEHMIEFFHGYTYSAHPLACAAALGTLATYAEEGLLTRAAKMAAPFESAVHALEGLPNVIIEALVLDTPVVSTDCPSGPREILGEACPGCLVPVNDAAALAEAIARALADPPQLSRVDLSAYAADTAAAAYEALAAERASPRGVM